jgi:transcription antitermination protein NusB
VAGRERHRARIAAMQALYEADVMEHPADQIIDQRLNEEDLLAPDLREFFTQMVRGVLENRAVIDGIIEQSAPHWPIYQMPPVDKAILRMAIWELRFNRSDPAPPKAVINEAVELAKRFGSENSGRFVNGVLGTVVA